MPRPDPRTRDRWVQDLSEERDARDLREQSGRKDLNHDPGTRDVVNDAGQRDLEELGARRPGPAAPAVHTAISGGVLSPSHKLKARRARGKASTIE